MFRRLYYWWYRRQNHVPHRRELAEMMPLMGTKRLMEIADMYVKTGLTVEEIAAYYNALPMPERGPPVLNGKRLPMKDAAYRMFLIMRPISRERIRQMLWKVWRTNRVGRTVRTASSLQASQD